MEARWELLAPATPEWSHWHPCPAEEGIGSALPGIDKAGEAHSLFAQLPSYVTALEALEVVEAAGQPASGLADPLAPIGQGICAARLQPLGAAQL